MHQPFRQGSQTGAVYQRESVSRLSLGTINVIFETSSWVRGHLSEVMSITRPNTENQVLKSKWGRLEFWPTLGFADEDKVGTYQPHDNALVVTLRIGGYNVKRVLIDQGSGAEIMYPNLYKGLNLKLEHSVSYDYPLVGFDDDYIEGLDQVACSNWSRSGWSNFVVVDASLPYTAILARPWLHAMVVVSLTLHMKVKYPSRGQVRELIGS